MVSPVLNENFYTGDFLISEAPGMGSRDVGLISNGATVDLQQEAGLVLSHAAGTPAATAGIGNTGNGTLGSITAGKAMQIGEYSLIATAATTFDVIDPDGVNLGTATAGTPFTSAELNLTVTAGGAAFVVGDTFTVNVPGAGYASYTGAANLPAVAVLYNLAYVPASGSKKVTVMSRNCEVNKAELQWDPSIANAGTVTAAAETAALASLAARGIIAR